MLTGRKNFLLRVFITAVISLSFIGGDCSTNDDPETVPDQLNVASPGSVSFSIDAVPGGNSYALISWTASPDENRNDFKGYRIRTVSVNSSGQVLSTFEERELPKTAKTYQVLSINRGTRYKTFLFAELNSGTKSDSLATDIYSGVFYNNDGIIDSYTAGPSSSQSGYGWGSSGAGTQYTFSETNAGSIDINLRLLENELFLFSPDVFNSQFKSTIFSLVGSGSQAFNETELLEPSGSIIKVQQDNVYLIKTEENYYIKIWIKEILDNILTSGYYSLKFDYKVQSVEGLRVVKR
jgi:hypothetical protein